MNAWTLEEAAFCEVAADAIAAPFRHQHVHEVQALVRPGFRFALRPQRLRLAVHACELRAVEPARCLQPMDHREFARRMRAGELAPCCLARMDGHAFAYYAPDILLEYLGQYLSQADPASMRRAHARHWMDLFVDEHGAGMSTASPSQFSPVQRFVVASVLRVLLAEVASGRRHAIARAAHRWHPV